MANKNWFARLGLSLCNKLPFAALPLLVNGVVWSILHRVTDWPFFAVEDLAYFAIVVAGETTLMAWSGASETSGRSGVLRPALLTGPIVLVAVSALVVASWHQVTANPRATHEFDPELWLYISVAGACAALAVAGAIANLAVSSPNPLLVPTMEGLLCGRFVFAILPVLFTGLMVLLSNSEHIQRASQLVRISDVCFFSIAVSGPAILDLVHSSAHDAATRGVWSIPPLALIVASSALLGFWYFITLVPAEPTALWVAQKIQIIDGLKTSAITTAVLSALIALFVQRQTFLRVQNCQRSGEQDVLRVAAK